MLYNKTRRHAQKNGELNIRMMLLVIKRSSKVPEVCNMDALEKNKKVVKNDWESLVFDMIGSLYLLS